MKTVSFWCLGAILLAAFLTARDGSRVPLSILASGSGVLALVWLFLRAKRTDPAMPRPASLSLLLAPPALLALWGILQVAFGWTADAPGTQGSPLLWITCACIAFAGLQTFDSRTRDRFLSLALHFACIVAVVCLVFLRHTPGFGLRYFPALAELTLPVAAIPALQKRGASIRHYLLATALVAALAASGSRTAAILALAELGALAGLVAIRETLPYGRIGLRLAFVLVCGALMLAAAGLLPNVAALATAPLAATVPGWHGWLASGVPALVALLLLAAWTARQCFLNIWCIGPLAVMAHWMFESAAQSPEVAALLFAMLSACQYAGRRNRT